jgi:hypothetical protein
MANQNEGITGHLMGGPGLVEKADESGPFLVNTFSGQVQVDWDPDASVTPLGQLAFFVEFLKQGGLFDPLVDNCPLYLTSPNAPSKRDFVGTLVLSILAGHRRYAHITCLQSDGVSPDLLGMEKILSEDSVRRLLKKIDELKGIAWLQGHLDYSTCPILLEPWILDADTTIKPLYGHQEGAVVSYNPKKPGRPSHAYHSYIMAGSRLVLDVAVEPGNEHTSKHASPSLWALLHRLERAQWPKLLRGDAGWGSEANMARAEQEGLAYLFRLRITAKVKSLIARLTGEGNWVDAGNGWATREAELRLSGWSRQRRVVVLRRRVKERTGLVASEERDGQLLLGFPEITAGADLYEYAVLVTSLDAELEVFGQLYRDRGDAENVFDELKGHWGWGGFTTRDLARCRLIARLVALVYNWWSIYARLIDPQHHREAITSRPLLLHAVARQVRHAKQTHITITSSHGGAPAVRRRLAQVVTFLSGLENTAEQLSYLEKWCRILSRALIKYLNGRVIRPPPGYLPA